MINGNAYRDMIISAATYIENQKNEINSLNVFPVPDGDTGTNMSLTMSAAANAVSTIENKSIGEVSDIVASALLKGARGNSGVILSLLFRGISKGFAGLESANGLDLAKAFSIGVTTAYKAVMKPTEGTILTVARVAAEQSLEYVSASSGALEILRYYIEEAAKVLEQTPEMLPVLKQAGVVDAGGKGLLVILQGMLYFLNEGSLPDPVEFEEAIPVDFSEFNVFSDIEEIKFAYCTEYIINKKESSKAKNFGDLRAYLESIGDCVVVVEDGDIIKVHIHTNHPGRAIEEAIRYGALVNIKIDNMRDQFQNTKEQTPLEADAPPHKRYGFVSVAAGDGIVSVMKDLGVDVVVEGGQTMNPSTEDIVAAVSKTPAQTVFVFPNNKNIIMAAQQAIKLCEKQVIVIETKTIPQGISALVAFEDSMEPEEIKAAMDAIISTVKTAQITCAARDSIFNGKEIKEGQLLGLIEGKLSFVDDEIEKIVSDIFDNLMKNGGDYINIYYGEDITEQQAEQIRELVTNKADGAEVVLLPGNQPVYYYIFSVE